MTDRPPVRAVRLAAACAALVLGAGLAACSEDTPDAAAPTSSTAAPPTSAATLDDARVVGDDGPAADLSEEVTGGTGTPFLGAATPAELPEGWVEQELFAVGEATDYVADGELTPDGRWTFAPDTTAAYRTRVVVRRPAEADFSGTVVVEWLNVSGGVDANPDWASLDDEIVRRGHAWVGVSAQLIGVAGGPVLVTAPGAEGLAGQGLVALDPERYASLDHPGDGYAFDLFTQVARALRAGDGLDGLEPDVVLAVGESQSALALTTYYNGVQPITEAFDGFLVHSRAFAALPLVAPGEYADLAGGLVANPEPVLLRDDLDAPVLVLQAEGDVIGLLDSYSARQDDSDVHRLWEVAGTSHADTNLLGTLADALDCGAPINDGPMHVVAKAALRALDDWVRTGEAPPVAPRLEVTVPAEGGEPEVARDADGIALGGIRTPPVDAPVVVLSGEPGPNPDLICVLMGSTNPLPPERIAERYASVEAYEAAYAEATDAAVAAGFVLEDDREVLAAYADASLVAG